MSFPHNDFAKFMIRASSAFGSITIGVGSAAKALDKLQEMTEHGFANVIVSEQAGNICDLESLHYLIERDARQ